MTKNSCTFAIWDLLVICLMYQNQSFYLYDHFPLVIFQPLYIKADFVTVPLRKWYPRYLCSDWPPCYVPLQKSGLHFCSLYRQISVNMWGFVTSQKSSEFKNKLFFLFTRSEEWMAGFETLTRSTDSNLSLQYKKTCFTLFGLFKGINKSRIHESDPWTHSCYRRRGSELVEN